MFSQLIFSKRLRLNEPWIILKSEWTIQRLLYTHTQQQGLQAFLLGLEASKHLVKQYRMGMDIKLEKKHICMGECIGRSIVSGS